MKRGGRGLDWMEVQTGPFDVTSEVKSKEGQRVCRRSH